MNLGSIKEIFSQMNDDIGKLTTDKTLEGLYEYNADCYNILINTFENLIPILKNNDDPYVKFINRSIDVIRDNIVTLCGGMNNEFTNPKVCHLAIRRQMEILTLITTIYCVKNNDDKISCINNVFEKGKLNPTYTKNIPSICKIEHKETDRIKCFYDNIWKSTIKSNSDSDTLYKHITDIYPKSCNMVHISSHMKKKFNYDNIQDKILDFYHNQSFFMDNFTDYFKEDIDNKFTTKEYITGEIARLMTDDFSVMINIAHIATSMVFKSLNYICIYNEK